MNWIEVGDARLALGDCLEAMATLEPQSIDAILTDLPYQVTALKWDVIIPFAPMWAAVKRVLKPRGVFVTTASQPFTSLLVTSNITWFKYCWVWLKHRPGDIFNAKNKPMKNHEDVCVFSEGTTANGSDRKMIYHPQGLVDRPITTKNCYRKDGEGAFKRKRPSHPEYVTTEYGNYPTTIIDIPTGRSPDHPTQKPVALYDYLVRTYTNEGDTVLDFCFGSCTTGVACIQTGRKFIGVEKDEGYFNISVKRITEAQQQLRLPIGGDA